MLKDRETTIGAIRERLKKFRDERNWNRFHDPKNLAEAISIEAAELLELFLWETPENIMQRLDKDPDFAAHVREELADVICFCFNFANATEIDISAAIDEKIRKNERNYPIEKALKCPKKGDIK